MEFAEGISTDTRAPSGDQRQRTGPAGQVKSTRLAPSPAKTRRSIVCVSHTTAYATALPSGAAMGAAMRPPGCSASSVVVPAPMRSRRAPRATIVPSAAPAAIVS